MRRSLSVLLTAGFISLSLIMLAAVKQRRHAPGQVSLLSRTYLAVTPKAPLILPPLLASDGQMVTPQTLQGHWSVIFFGFTRCPLVCPRTLGVLSAYARDASNAAPAQNPQIVFVSVDSEHDSPTVLRTYLARFGRNIRGFTGTRAAIDQFSHDLGAGYRFLATGIDHTTSLFVTDPQGRLAGILLHPNDPATIRADLGALRRSYGER